MELRIHCYFEYHKRTGHHPINFVPIYTQIVQFDDNEYKNVTIYSSIRDKGPRIPICQFDLDAKNPISSHYISKLSKRVKQYWLTLLDNQYEWLMKQHFKDFYTHLFVLYIDLNKLNNSNYDYVGEIKCIEFKPIDSIPFKADFFVGAFLPEMNRFWVVKCLNPRFKEIKKFYKFQGLVFREKNNSFIIDQINLRYIDEKKIGRYATKISMEGFEFRTPIGLIWICSEFTLIKQANDFIPYPKPK